MAKENIVSNILRDKILVKLLEIVSIVEGKQVLSYINESVDFYTDQLNREKGEIVKPKPFDASINSEADKIEIFNNTKQWSVDTQSREIEVVKLCRAALLDSCKSKISAI